MNGFYLQIVLIIHRIS